MNYVRIRDIQEAQQRMSYVRLGHNDRPTVWMMYEWEMHQMLSTLPQPLFKDLVLGRPTTLFDIPIVILQQCEPSNPLDYMIVIIDGKKAYRRCTHLVGENVSMYEPELFENEMSLWRVGDQHPIIIKTSPSLC